MTYCETGVVSSCAQTGILSLLVCVSLVVCVCVCVHLCLCVLACGGLWCLPECCQMLQMLSDNTVQSHSGKSLYVLELYIYT